MKNKKEKKRIILLVTVVVFITVGSCLYLKYRNSNYIPEDYIAVFYGGEGAFIYSTYIYKVNNGQANYGFKYINTTSTIDSWSSSELKTKITNRGRVAWTDDVFAIAKENNAYSYVILPNNEIYSIEEFMTMFSMD